MWRVRSVEGRQFHFAINDRSGGRFSKFLGHEMPVWLLASAAAAAAAVEKKKVRRCGE